MRLRAHTRSGNLPPTFRVSSRLPTPSSANSQCGACPAVLADRRACPPRYPWPSTGRIWGANCLYTVETIDGAVWSRVQPAELISHDPLLFRSGNGTAKDSSIVSPGSIQRCRSKIPRTPPSISISTIVGDPFLDLPGIMSAAKSARSAVFDVNLGKANVLNLCRTEYDPSANINSRNDGT